MMGFCETRVQSRATQPQGALSETQPEAVSSLCGGQGARSRTPGCDVTERAHARPGTDSRERAHARPPACDVTERAHACLGATSRSTLTHAWVQTSGSVLTHTWARTLQSVLVDGRKCAHAHLGADVSERAHALTRTWTVPPTTHLGSVVQPLRCTPVLHGTALIAR